MPPPGMSVPPPPGAAPPGPTVPNAEHDPFGAMNAMAQIGTAQRAPEIVIVHDGKPVESVSAGEKAAFYGKYAALVVVPLAIGIAIAQVGVRAGAYNDGIKGAKLLIKDVKDVKGKMAAVRKNLTGADKKDKFGREATNALKGLKDLEVKTGAVLKYKQNMGADLAGEVMDFYAQVTTLQTMVNEHLETARSEDALLANVKANAEKAMLPPTDFLSKAVGYRYAVMVWNPNEEDAAKSSFRFGARVVEIGPPYCQGSDKVATSGTCPEDKPVEALSYRDNPGGSWQKAEFAIPGQNLDAGAAVPSKKILIMSPNGVLDTLIQDCAGQSEGKCVKSTGGAAAEAAYQKRLAEIRKRLDEAVESANKLEARLSPKANEGNRFTFFM